MKVVSLKSFLDQVRGCSHPENFVDRCDREAMGPRLLFIVVFPGKVTRSRSTRPLGFWLTPTEVLRWALRLQSHESLKPSVGLGDRQWHSTAESSMVNLDISPRSTSSSVDTVAMFEALAGDGSGGSPSRVLGSSLRPRQVVLGTPGEEQGRRPKHWQTKFGRTVVDRGHRLKERLFGQVPPTSGYVLTSRSPSACRSPG